MKKNILLFSIPIIVVILLLGLSFNKISEIDSKRNDIINIEKELNFVSSELEIEKLFSLSLIHI